MTEPSIQSVDEKINRFIESQDKHNDTVTNAIKEISTAISKMDSFQVEMNNQNEKISNCVSKIDRLDIKTADLSEKVNVNSTLMEDFKHLKKLVMGFIVIAVLGGGYVTKTTNENSANKDLIMQEQAKSMSEIAKAIEKKINEK